MLSIGFWSALAGDLESLLGTEKIFTHVTDTTITMISILHVHCFAMISINKKKVTNTDHGKVFREIKAINFTKFSKDLTFWFESR